MNLGRLSIKPRGHLLSLVWEVYMIEVGLASRRRTWKFRGGRCRLWAWSVCGRALLAAPLQGALWALSHGS